ncbi:carbohydrate esterase family 4 protein [Moniliophthora roreri]|nr:carbohydrate esterase family 4 protein [Moniliophthora roreri]
MIVTRSFAAVALVSLLKFVSAADRSTVAEQAALTDPVEQCKPYNYPSVVSQIANFPKVWATATIPTTDTAARAKFDAIFSSIPKIAPKGNISATLLTYDRVNDPDCWWTAGGCTEAKTPGVPSDISLVPEPQTLGYGFDDGPNCSHNAFYDYMSSQNQKATMFFIGSNVLGWPLQAKRAFEDGHEICVHGWSHKAMTGFTNEEAWAELYYSESFSTSALNMQAIKVVTGATPTCFRPPLGDIDDRIRYIAHSLGLKTMLWKYDTYDTIPGKSGVVEVAAVERNYAEFIQLAKGGAFAREGAILLAHETNNMTMEQAIKWYPQLKEAFKHIVPVYVALNETKPYVEKNVTAPNFQQYVSARSNSSKDEKTNDASSILSSLSTYTTITYMVLYWVSSVF